MLLAWPNFCRDSTSFNSALRTSGKSRGPSSRLVETYPPTAAPEQRAAVILEGCAVCRRSEETSAAQSMTAIR